MRTLALLALSLLLLGAACRNDAAATVTTPNGSVLELPDGVEAIDFPLGEATISTASATYRLSVEIAETPAQSARGLMYRTSMPEEAGMLFVFPSDRTGGFWMMNTLIPLSIAYIAADGTIVTLRDMEPCGSDQQRCAREAEAYLPEAPYRYALEVNQGYFDARGIGVGDSVSFTRD